MTLLVRDDRKDWEKEEFSLDSISPEKEVYVKIEQIKFIYEIFNLKMMSGIDIQAFFYLMKRSSEDLGFPIKEMKESEYDYEEYIELSVCREFLRGFLKGAVKVLREVGYSNSSI